MTGVEKRIVLNPWLLQGVPVSRLSVSVGKPFKCGIEHTRYASMSFRYLAVRT